MRDEIDREFAQTLAEMTLLSYGPVSRFDKSGGRSSEHPGGRRPQGDSNPLHHEYAKRYARARETDEETEQREGASTRRARRRVLDEAREALESVLRRPESAYTEETAEQRDQRMIDDYAGWPAKDVALKMHCTPTHVRKIRMNRALDPDTGQEREEVPSMTAAERAEKARRMKDQGMSAKRIALVLGVHYDTVRRDLGKKAA